jgi:dTMP kinase
MDKLGDKPVSDGVFVVFEGGDACGKTTQVDMLDEKLEGLGIATMATSFPRYGTAVGNTISRHLRGEVWLADKAVGRAADNTITISRATEDALVFQALQTLDKYEAAANIKAWLVRGYMVVSSRWYQSAEIYGADDGLDEGLLKRAHACLPRANLNILLHTSSEASLAMRPDLRDRFERDRAKQDRVRQRYLDMWEDRARSSFVDGCGHFWPTVYCDGKSAAEVHDEVWDLLLKVPGVAARVAKGLNALRGTKVINKSAKKSVKRVVKATFRTFSNMQRQQQLSDWFFKLYMSSTYGKFAP